MIIAIIFNHTCILRELVKTAFETFETTLNGTKDSFANPVVTLGLLLDILHQGSNELNNSNQQ